MENEEIVNPETENPETEVSDQAGTENISEAFTESLLLNISDRFDELMEVVEEQKAPLTSFETESGTINVIHEVTLGELLLGTLLALIFIMQLTSSLIRRF